MELEYKILFCGAAAVAAIIAIAMIVCPWGLAASVTQDDEGGE